MVHGHKLCQWTGHIQYWVGNENSEKYAHMSFIAGPVQLVRQLFAALNKH